MNVASVPSTISKAAHGIGSSPGRGGSMRCCWTRTCLKSSTSSLSTFGNIRSAFCAWLSIMTVCHPLSESGIVLMPAALFLSNLNVMDYSLVVGVDKDRKELVIGIVDYIRTFTWYFI